MLHLSVNIGCSNLKMMNYIHKHSSCCRFLEDEAWHGFFCDGTKKYHLPLLNLSLCRIFSKSVRFFQDNCLAPRNDKEIYTFLLWLLSLNLYIKLQEKRRLQKKRRKQALRLIYAAIKAT